MLFRSRGLNRNFLRFRDEDLPALAVSFTGQPFLRNHDTHDIGARDGTILASSLDGDYFKQTIRLTTRQGMTDYVEGRIDRFSIGWNYADIFCTVCNSRWVTCSHMPGRSTTRPMERCCASYCSRTRQARKRARSIPLPWTTLACFRSLCKQS